MNFNQLASAVRKLNQWYEDNGVLGQVRGVPIMVAFCRVYVCVCVCARAPIVEAGRGASVPNLVLLAAPPNAPSPSGAGCFDVFHANSNEAYRDV